ncbi:MAG: SUMF1/EgtB/PvdO family nonheme iron enzyme [Alphaproteobacteria bacterium]|nr:SUMF1/EgtB/PvdO family nonheme iron enzyme [Alphaproteobacteria bacterium]
MRRAATLIVAGAAVTLSVMSRLPITDGMIDAPEVVTLQPHSLLYPDPGEFTRDGKTVAAPIRLLHPTRALAVMRHQVTSAEYRRCVDDRGCPAVPGLADDRNQPAVKVSWRDATAYAAWLSRRLGATYRLPTDEEWAFAAGSRFTPALASASDDNPAEIALRRYERVAGVADVEAKPRPIGSFGANENGVLDLGGNVSEWTDTCYRHMELNAAAAAPILNCGIRVVEGRHRGYLPDFIRDARAGGCSVGTPPANLGFRLMREEPREWPAAGDQIERPEL